MEWFTGDVAAAVTAAKQRQTIFCVFISGEDEASLKLLDLIKDRGLSERFDGLVCIQITAGSTTFSQFSQIYPVLLVPSIFYVDSLSGMDIEVTVAVGDATSILAGLERAKEKFADMKTGVSREAGAQPSSSSSLPKPEISEQQDLGSRVSRARTMLDENVGSVGPVTGHDTPTSLEDRVERARRLMQQRKEETEKAEQDKEKEKEKERRNLGKDIEDMKRKQEEESIKKLTQERRKEKEEERLARERVKAAIEQDRADRAAKFQMEKSKEDERRKEKERKILAEKAAEAERVSASRSSISRIQFRLPDGRSQTQQFPADTPLGDVYQWVTTDLATGFSSFSLSTSFPRRDLDKEVMTSTLKELQLAPSATILVLPRASGLVSVHDGSLTALLLLLLSPFTFLWGLLSSVFTPAPNPAGNSSPNPSGTRRKNAGNTAGKAGNIGRLRQSDSDDENNTNNGNSTQQM